MVEFVQRYYGKRLGEVQVSMVFFDMMNILRRYRVRVNPTFTLVNIAIAVTEGIGKQLDPDVDLMAAALPFFARFNFFQPGRDGVDPVVDGEPVDVAEVAHVVGHQHAPRRQRARGDRSTSESDGAWPSARRSALTRPNTTATRASNGRMRQPPPQPVHRRSGSSCGCAEWNAP